MLSSAVQVPSHAAINTQLCTPCKRQPGCSQQPRLLHNQYARAMHAGKSGTSEGRSRGPYANYAYLQQQYMWMSMLLHQDHCFHRSPQPFPLKPVRSRMGSLSWPSSADRVQSPHKRQHALAATRMTVVAVC